MTQEEAWTLVDQISDSIGDDEAAHSLEDRLYLRFIKEVADIKNQVNFTYFDLAELIESANIILAVEDMPFARWKA